MKHLALTALIAALLTGTAGAPAGAVTLPVGGAHTTSMPCCKQAN